MSPTSRCTFLGRTSTQANSPYTPVFPVFFSDLSGQEFEVLAGGPSFRAFLRESGIPDCVAPRILTHHQSFAISSFISPVMDSKLIEPLVSQLRNGEDSSQTFMEVQGIAANGPAE